MTKRNSLSADGAFGTAPLRRPGIHVLLCMILLSVIVLLESFTDMDMRFQNLWYDREHCQWLITRGMHEEWRWLFYGGMKKFVSAVGIAAFLCSVVGGIRKRPRLARGGVLLMLSVIILPMLIGWLKSKTNIYCPRELVDFGGVAAWQHVLGFADPANAGLVCGRCFPAGHASGGFAGMIVFFCVSRKRRWAALFVALAVAWTMGLYQMLRGEHFLSHTMATMAIAWMVDVLLVWGVDSCGHVLTEYAGRFRSVADRLRSALGIR